MKAPCLQANDVDGEKAGFVYGGLISRIFDQKDIAYLLAADIGEVFAVL